MTDLPAPPRESWRIDLSTQPRVLTEAATAALARAAEEVVTLRTRARSDVAKESAASALRSAVILGVNEHEIADATKLPLAQVRALLREG
ncbi:hypothetical protein [Rathayibacter sp. SD072]|uniref:hypothetical protein n=1 Tax=Rathayibacter sp. SD072 TaxID=2781731 RepID=UPI001A976732|nr:hypothetical protein [Rathayibacter sp. SD072]MBO0984999.1 hypothetical protein [Rathayibacter sp. SD072]